jgi:hypothetical protein
MTTLGVITTLCLLLVGFAVWKKDFVKAGIWVWRFGFVLEARQASSIEHSETKVGGDVIEKS